MLEHLLKKCPTGTRRDKADILKKLVSCILDGFEVFYIHRDKISEAYNVFETVNARGKTLTQADLLKNYFFSKCNPNGNDNSSIESQWNKLSNIFNNTPNKLTLFIRHYWIATRGLVSVHYLYRTIANNLTTSSDIDAFIKDLLKYAPDYCYLKNPIEGEKRYSDCAELQMAIENLYYLNFDIYIPLFLAMVKTGYTHKNISNVLNAIWKYVVRNITVSKKRSGIIWGQITKYSEKISQPATILESTLVDEIIGEINARKLDNDSFASELEKYNFSKRNDFAKLLLRQICNTDTMEIRNKLQVEHILPEKPKKNEWKEFDKVSHDIYCYKLGNLTLLTPSDNRELSNAEFDIKRKNYSTCSLEITKKISECSTWTEEEINKRTTDLISILVTKI